MQTGRFLGVAGLLVVALVAAECSKPAQTPPPAQAPKSTAPALLGDMKPVVSVKELMQYVIDPLSDNIFNAVWTDIGPKGPIEHHPVTNEDWESVRSGAIGIAETVYLLKVPRPFAPAGDVNNSTGPNPPELSPTQIQALVDKDPVTWNAKIEALRNVGLEVMNIVNRVGSKPILFPDPFVNDPGPKMGTEDDVNQLFNAAEDLDKACESCHLEYWYPGDKKAVEEDARQRARFEEPGAGAAKSPEKPEKKN